MSSLRKKLLFIISAQIVVSACHSQASKPDIAMTQKDAIEKVTTINTPDRFSAFEQKIAQKMIVDIRYFCDDVENNQVAKPANKNCRQGVTELPIKLSQMITTSNVGGIVLFAENVVATEQIVTLTHDIQRAALKSASAKAIIIAVDQEGGRVARFAKMTGFSGNMAIGATFDEYDTNFAKEVNTVLGKELHALGINNNYAPVVDVNTNADNPVINTRSYGENAQQVAKLGVAAVNALQAQGVMATLKHFPGHGDTHVDSHIGLPRVNHDLATIKKVDLAPFTLAIKATKPAMIMTAHIQYPALDDSLFTAKSGEQLIRPATMSKKILTDLLRNKMAFDGIIATDALDMAGISHYFTEIEAVVETFVAGADLAVMPFKIRKPTDIAEFYAFIKDVAKALTERMNQDDYSASDFELSVARLAHFKNEYAVLAQNSLATKIDAAKRIIANAGHLSVEQDLANAAVTLLQGDLSSLLSDFAKAEKGKNRKKICLVVANEQEFLALSYALKQSLAVMPEQDRPQVKHFIADSDFSQANKETLISQADLLIATVDVKTASLVDIGGMDDLASVKTRRYGSEGDKQKKQSYAQLLKRQLRTAKQSNIPSVLIAKGSPYLLADYASLVDVVLLNFDDRIYNNEHQQVISPGFTAAMAVMFTQQPLKGRLPVSLNVE